MQLKKWKRKQKKNGTRRWRKRNIEGTTSRSAMEAATDSWLTEGRKSKSERVMRKGKVVSALEDAVGIKQDVTEYWRRQKGG